MTKTKALTAAAVLTFAVAALAGAQQKEIAGDMKTVTGTVEAIDHAQRVLTLKIEGDEFVTLDIPNAAKRFDEVKIGDKVQTRYYDNVTVRIKDPGEKDVDMASAKVTPSDSARPGATVSAQRSMTVTITAIDSETGSATYEGPRGYKYSRRIQDKEMANKVKVGDKLDVTWTEAVQISVIPK